ncbi:MAG: hypothetical protein NZ601_05090 [candidate division WOR-3 bacterium]|nr:hypothetical protein [candidate division WOR-3 bacterium]MCX7757059.1 hypothetical protein [candidate division WOR-3 bacterium]MDW7987242.1 hypothetical protein [candidate division WOR-3 bacterium]
MAHVYTPGLKVTSRTVVRKERRLPLKGQVLVSKGQKVQGEDIVARTSLPGDVTTVNVAGLLGVPPEDIKMMMVKRVGDEVRKNEVIAQSKGFFGLFKSTVKSPIDGIIESISEITGQVILREPPKPVEIKAYIDGVVAEVIPEEGVIIETQASLIQGIFGVGGETRGIIKVLAKSPDDDLTADKITEDCKDKIIVGGSIVDFPALQKAREVGAKGVVVGGIEDATLKAFLGYDIGVAITGHENCGLTIMVTEGFGRMRMANHTFKLINELNNKMASMNGATQIRAGVIRPELIVPLEAGAEGFYDSAQIFERGLEIGSTVRIIREPLFGRIGKVVALPAELQQIETESKVRILEVELEDGKRVILPRANVELIEE